VALRIREHRGGLAIGLAEEAVVLTRLLGAALIGIGSGSILWLMGGHPLIREMALD